jgi:heme exporter protein D
LLLAAILNGSVFFNALYSHAMDDPQSWIGIGFAITLTLAALAPIACIALYKNRENQVKWVTRSLILQLVVLGYGIGIFISLGGFGTFLWDEAVGIGMLIIALLSQIYARKKIKDDIELVKSMDRIR